jgi:hypothetical protein
MEGAKTMEVFVKTLAGKTAQLTALGSFSVLHFQLIFHRREGIPKQSTTSKLSSQGVNLKLRGFFMMTGFAMGRLSISFCGCRAVNQRFTYGHSEWLYII